MLVQLLSLVSSTSFGRQLWIVCCCRDAFSAFISVFLAKQFFFSFFRAGFIVMNVAYVCLWTTVNFCMANNLWKFPLHALLYIASDLLVEIMTAAWKTSDVLCNDKAIFRLLKLFSSGVPFSLAVVDCHSRTSYVNVPLFRSNDRYICLFHLQLGLWLVAFFVRFHLKNVSDHKCVSLYTFGT